MNLKRSPLLFEYAPLQVGLRGSVVPLPFYGIDSTGATESARKRAEASMLAAKRRRERLRELAIEQWRALVSFLSED